MKNIRKQSGFTLIEIMIVIVILGIAALIMVPLMSNNTFFQLQAAVRDLDSAIQYTQNLAITGQQRYKIVFDLDANTFVVSDESDEMVDDPARIAPSGTTEPEKYKLRRAYDQEDQYERVTLSAVSFDGESILWFDRLGTPYSGEMAAMTPLASGEVTLTAGNHSMTVFVSPVSGKTRIE